MNHQGITLHNTKTEEIIGTVTSANETMDFSLLYDLVRGSFVRFNENIADHVDNEYDYPIEDFVEWHNKNYTIKLDYILMDFIQL